MTGLRFQMGALAASRFWSVPPWLRCWLQRVLGLFLLIVDPADGSTAEGALGIAAVVAGQSTGALVIAACIYAQAKDPWRAAPLKIRVVSWAFIAVGVAATVWNLVAQPFSD